MGDNQVLIKIDRALAEEIDVLVGDRQRTKFVHELLEKEVRRRRLKAWLADDEAAWKDEDHPEFEGRSSADYISEMRKRETTERLKKLGASE
jgi:hypothetical protein